jgi:hypothetical protein
MDEISEQARAAVGADNPDSDWKLSPHAHAAALPPAAAALRRVLEHSELRTIIKEFEIADADAVTAQHRYKRIALLRLYTGVIATIIGATFLIPFATSIIAAARDVPAALQYGCLFVTFFAGLWLARAAPFDDWMKARARAEIARISLFDKMMDSEDASPQPGELPLLPLKLEYFRRYQLDVQRRYYAGRGKQHAHAAGWTRRWQVFSTALSGLAAIVAVAAGLRVVIDLGLPLPHWVIALNDVIEPQLPAWTSKAILALGIIASTLFGASVTRSLMDLDERNASRYLTTAANLDYLAKEKLARIREQAAAGSPEPVRAFFDQIQQMISSEHQEWMLLREAGSMPIRRVWRAG